MSESLSRFCPVCQSIKWIPVTERTQRYIKNRLGSTIPNTPITVGDKVCFHAETFGVLKRSANEANCPFCSIILYELQYSGVVFRERHGARIWDPEDDESSSSLPVLLRNVPRLDSHRLFFVVNCGDRTFSMNDEQLPESLLKFTSGQDDHLDTSTGSLKSLQLAKAWLQTCCEGHERCATYCGNEPPQLPTRVLDVGSAQESDIHPYLFLSHGQTGLYITLSHCWGNSQPITTTCSTLIERQRGIPFPSLPQTFQDAVVITRALGVRYLWIDSLCIIQDSREDWDAESARMGDIYKNARCTISAAKSAGPDDGCFTMRDPVLHRPIHLPMMNSIGPPDDVSSSSSPGTGTTTKRFWYAPRYPTPLGPLYKRAWVFQEQALSGRNIAFTHDMMFWSCLTSVADEQYPTGQDHRTVQAMTTLQLFQELVVEYSHGVDAKSESLDEEEERDMYSLWYAMVTEYGRRNITYQTDRLPALSALATYTSRILGDKYVAGLWYGDLVNGLLWTCRGEGKRHRPPDPYVAPSWSWTSVSDGMISMDYANHVRRRRERAAQSNVNVSATATATSNTETDSRSDTTSDDLVGEIEILDIRCIPTGQNQFGQLSDGRITLNGWVRNGVASLATRDILEPNSGHPIGGLNLDERPEPDLEGTVVCCLFMAWGKTAQEDEEGIQFTDCLALVPTGRHETEYRRIGLTGIEGRYWEYDCERRQIVLV